MSNKKVPIADPSSSLDKYKSWFRYSMSIFLARVLALSGVITTFVGGLDFSPLWTVLSTGTDFTRQQLIWIGIAIIGTGVSFEMARRRTL